MKNYFIAPLTHDQASEIITWVYEPPYDVYNVSGEDALTDYLDGSYYGVTDKGKLIGFICFGKSAQVPNDTGVYHNMTLTDMGLGLKPDLCGQGLGYAFIASGMSYGKERLGFDGYRLSVISTNQRAIKVYQTLGFVPTATFDVHRESGCVTFQVMVHK